jgi:hypothetical protein
VNNDVGATNDVRAKMLQGKIMMHEQKMRGRHIMM